ncbi:MAG TPA: hypothetical protein VGB83_04585 [Actinomycetota bacterium]
MTENTPQDPREIVKAGLDALCAVMDLDLAAYLHLPEGGSPELHMVRPSLSDVTPTEAFELLTSLRDTMGDEHAGDETLLLGGFLAVAVSTAGPTSRGVHVVGRRTAPMEPAERATAVKLARSIGSVAAFLDASGQAAAPAPATVGRVRVDTLGEGARAEVIVRTVGGEQPGSAEGATPLEAVAHATLSAVAPNLKVVEATEGQVSAERAVLVLLRDEFDHAELGAALIGESGDAPRAAARAALQAAGRLADPR